MKMLKREEFLKRSSDTLGRIHDVLLGLKPLGLKGIEAKNTAFLIVDMINGFAREGALMSPRVEALIPGITRVSEACDRLGIKKLAFADCHTMASPEFGAYPPHCLAGTSEAEIVKEIAAAGGYKLIHKNSTNGFLENEFQEWLKENPGIDTFILAGDCTDICIEQFANTLKAWFNAGDKRARVIVPVNLVDTYDLGAHDAELMNVMALFIMMGNGVEVVRDIELEG